MTLKEKLEQFIEGEASTYRNGISGRPSHAGKGYKAGAQKMYEIMREREQKADDILNDMRLELDYLRQSNSITYPDYSRLIDIINSIELSETEVE